MDHPFRVLFRQFLFRIVDIEVLSAHAHGDSSQLLGRFAALLVFFSVLSSMAAGLAMGAKLNLEQASIFTLASEHFLISTTMLVVGLFAVLSWDATFPDRRDVLVLVPLPLRASAMFLAKVSAVAASLGLTILLLHGPAGFLWPLAFFQLGNDHGVWSFLKCMGAHWFIVFASGAFTYCLALCVQGAAAQLLSRRMFLRASSALQLGMFALVVLNYFLQPSFGELAKASHADVLRTVCWVPSYWFLGLFQQLNGPASLPFTHLAAQAWMGFALFVAGAAVLYLGSYSRMLRSIVEEPDIAPGSGWGGWLPRFRDSAETALVQFTMRTLLRSRQHRMILAFYLGIGFALTAFAMRTQPTCIIAGSNGVAGPFLSATIILTILFLVGTRVVFALPLELRANWIFKVAGPPAKEDVFSANRASFLFLAILPTWSIASIICFSQAPWRPAMGHLILLALFGIGLTEFCLYRFRKIPFTCSYLPGKSQVHMVFLGGLLLMRLVIWVADWEAQMLTLSLRFAMVCGGLGLLAAGLRWGGVVLERLSLEEVQFEEIPPQAVQELGVSNVGS